MTVSQRTNVEKAKQCMPGVRDFSATPNSRLHATYDEAKTFAQSLRKYEKQTQGHIRSMKEFSHHTKDLLNTQLPNLYHDHAKGTAVAQEGGRLVGSPSDMERVVKAGNSEQAGMQQHVQNPIYKWLADFDSLKIDMDALDKLRLLLDSRRRSLAKAEGRLSKAASRTDDESNPKVVKATQEKNKEAMKMEETQKEYVRKEESTFDRLKFLVDEVQDVRHHLKVVVSKQQEVYEGMAQTIPDTGMAKRVMGDAPTTTGTASDDQNTSHPIAEDKERAVIVA